MSRFLGLGAGILIVLGISGFVFLNSYTSKKRNLESSFILNIERGSSLYAVAKNLNQKMDIGPPRLFVKVGQFYGYASQIKFGEYEIPPGVSVLDLFDMLASGKTKKYQYTFVEGSHIYDLAKVLSTIGFGEPPEILSILRDTKVVEKLLNQPLDSLEGYLYPDTYFYSKTDSLNDLISRMVKRFDEVYGQLPSKHSTLTRHQMVTLASIIEKETGASFERPLISSVFHNRMAKGMRLETDPTVMYGILHNTGKEIKNIKKIHLKTPTSYNTYTIRGLPPGPIGNPGKEALMAAFQPKKSSHLFFVSRNDGTHVFTDSYKDHLKAVRSFQLNPKARQGKSWRDLKSAQ